MENKKKILITGGCGMVGGLMAIRAIREGFGVRILGRSKDGVPAEERIRRFFFVFGVSPKEWENVKENLEIYIGDVTLPRFGMNEEQVGRLTDRLFAITHTAAHISFDETQAAISAAVNIDGTRNVLKLAEMFGARIFHVSTAYIAGDCRGKVFEKEPTGIFPWKNVYEKTKFIAEREVHHFCRDKKIDYCVFRPAVLVGDSVEGRTIRFNNIYNFIKVAYSLSLRKKGARATIEADPAACLNIVPVDFAVDAMWRISQAPGLSVNLFHIANPAPPKFGDLVETFSNILNIKAECIHPEAIENTSGVSKGKRIGASFSEYNRYMFGEPEFDMKNTRSVIADYDRRFPIMDETYYRRILAYAVAKRWGKSKETALENPVAKSADHFVRLYFDRFLKGKLNRRLLQNLKSLDAVVAIRIRDEKHSSYVLELKRGMLISVSRNGLSPECGYETDISTFKAVVSGNYPPQKAFFEGKGDITGDIEKGLKVITALSEFFVRYPFDPKVFDA